MGASQPTDFIGREERIVDNVTTVREEQAVKKSKFTEEQISFALKQPETGTPVAEVIRRVMDEVRAGVLEAANQARAQMPAHFPDSIHASVVTAIKARLPKFDNAEAAL